MIEMMYWNKYRNVHNFANLMVRQLKTFIECQLCTIYYIELGVRAKQKDNAQILWVVQNSPGQNTGVGSYSLLQADSLSTQPPGKPMCIYAYMGFPGGIPSPGESSWPRNRTQVSCIADRLFTCWATREARICGLIYIIQTSFFHMKKLNFKKNNAYNPGK